MKLQGEYKYFHEGASLVTQFVGDENVGLDVTLDKVQVNEWNILPLMKPMVNS